MRADRMVREQALVCGKADLLDGPGYQPIKHDEPSPMTRTELAQTLGELVKVGLIESYRDSEDKTRYRLNKPPLLEAEP